MDADQLKDRLAEIAVRPMPDHEPELKALQKECKEGGYPQPIALMRKMLAQIVEVVEQERSAVEIAAAEDEANETIGGKFFVLSAGNRVRVGYWGEDDEGRPILATLSRFDFLTLVENQFVKVGEKMKPAGPFWLSSPTRREYDRLVMQPNGEVPPKTLNLWRGYGVEPKDGHCQPILDHIGEIICNGDTGLNEYVLNWIAMKCQQPERVMGTMLAMISGQGTGKGFLGQDLLLPIFGSHGRVLGDATMLTRAFNGHLLGAAFVFADEALFAGDKAGAQKIKGIITGKHMLIEKKGVDAFSVPSHLGILAAGNAEHMLCIDRDDRRVVVLDVSDKYKDKASYFEPLYAHLEAGGRRAFLAKMLARDISTFDPGRDRPTTEATIDQRAMSLSGVPQWWSLALDEEVTPFATTAGPRAFWRGQTDSKTLDASQGFEAERSVVRKAYDEWRKEQRDFSRPMGAKRFWNELRACSDLELSEGGANNARTVRFGSFNNQIKAMRVYLGAQERD